MSQFNVAPGSDGNKVEKVNYASMNFFQLEADPIAEPILQKVALLFLQTDDKDWYDRKFTGQLDSEGNLIGKREQYSGLKPSKHIPGFKIDKVAEMTKQELNRLNLI